MPRFQRRIAPVIRQTIGVGDRRIQGFAQVEVVDAHNVHVDVRVARSIWHIDAVKHVDAALFAKRMMGYRVFRFVLRECAFAGN